jgi:hypothetical protein
MAGNQYTQSWQVPERVVISLLLLVLLCIYAMGWKKK